MQIRNLLGAIASLLIGGIAAGVTLTGLVNSNVNTAPENTADVSKPVIDYGTRN